MKDLESWNPSDFYPTEFLSEPDGQLTIFFDVDEPPDPDDFETLEEFDQAYLDWDFRQSSITGEQLPVTSQVDQSSVNDTEQSDGAVIELPHGCLNVYVKKGNYYYRYSYRDGKKVKHIHLCPVRVKNDKQQELLDCVRRNLSKKSPIDVIIRTIDHLKNS